MTKIRLLSIVINNFKGIAFLKLNMEGKDSNIQGANGSGKTTIYKAYYWCLTGKTLEANETVQTLDSSNEVIHKIDTSVIVTLLINDSYEVTLERRLSEKWRALGMPDEQFTGTEQKQFFNEVPFSKAEFNAKLNSICDLEKWILLSNINAFMTLKTEERRKMLMDMAGEVDEQKLMQPYPAVQRAINVEKKNIEELQKQTLSTKKRSNDELKTIPSQIDAQDRLKVVADFGSIKKERENIEKEIVDIDRQLEGSTEELDAAKVHREKLQTLRKGLDDAVKVWKERHEKEREEAYKALSDAQNELDTVLKEQKEHAEEMTRKAGIITEKEEAFDKKKKEWIEENQKTFTLETLTSCPTCGHVFTEEEKKERGNAAIEIFNKEKSVKLKTLLDEATAINEQIAAVKGDYNEARQVIAPIIKNRVTTARSALNEKKQTLIAVMEQKLESNENISSLKAQIEAEEGKEIKKADSEEKQALKAKKKEYVAKRDELTKLLAGEDTNRRIEEEKERLNARAKDLAQIVADCDNTLYQIMEYKKSKVGAIEGKINGLFKIARWKFYEKNIADDNYTEVCKCLHNGVDYNSTNAADKINLGIDIVASIGKAYGIESVIFVDFKESVTNLQKVDNQIISLEVKADSPLTLNN